jgi:hypothetical protein
MKYKNPWHKKLDNTYGPEFYETEAKPKEYNGFFIYERIKGICFDIVKDGVCITQRAGNTNDGLYRVIDGIIDGTEERACETLNRSLS